METGQGLTAEARVIFQEIFAELERNKQPIDDVASLARATATADQDVMDAISTISAISERARPAPRGLGCGGRTKRLDGTGGIPRPRAMPDRRGTEESIAVFKLGG